MNIVIFVYTIALILVCAAAAVLSLATYVVSHRKALIPQALFFVFYILDLLSIFGYEWSSQNLPFDPARYYEVENPVIRTMLSAAILMSLWVMLLDVLDVHDRRLQVAPVVAFVCASVLVLVALPYGPVRQLLYYSMRQVFVAFALGYAWMRWRTSKDVAYRARLGRYRTRYLILVVLLLAIVLEDVMVILVEPIPSDKASWLLLYLSARNFSENLMMLFVAYLCCKQNLKTLALRFDVPPTVSTPQVVLTVPQDADERAEREDVRATDLRRHIDEQLPAYANAHRLSPREREVCAMVLEGKDNRTIASELVLAEGTIKTHVHNIIKKCGVATRDELRKDFWSR